MGLYYLELQMTAMFNCTERNRLDIYEFDCPNQTKNEGNSFKLLV